MDDVFDAVGAYIASQGWSLQEVVDTIWEVLPEAAKNAVAEMVQGLSKEQVVAMIESGDITVDDIVDAVVDWADANEITVDDVLGAIKDQCPAIFA